MEKKIDLAIVGAQKAGTTSLKNYMSEHPEIYTHAQIECAYFNTAKDYEKGWDHTLATYFPDLPKHLKSKLVMKNAGLYDIEEGIERLKAHNPEMHLVLLVRNPLERAWSSYTMEKTAGWLKRDFSEVIDELRKGQWEYTDQMYRLFVRLGLYSEQIKTMLKYFPESQIHVYRFEDMKNEPERICSEIFGFLGVDSNFKPNLKRVHNKTTKPKSEWLADRIMSLRRNHNPVKKFAKKILPQKLFTNVGNTLIEFNKSNEPYGKMPEEIREELREYFKPFNQELTRLTGLDTSNWN